MGYYEDVYLKRLNRYGNNYQERILTQRREVFVRRLLKSVYRIDFQYEDQTGATQSISATFERYKQDNTQTLRYLFTAYDVIIPNGTVLYLPDPIGLLRDSENQGQEIEFTEYSGPRPYIPDSEVYWDEDEGKIYRPWMVYYLEDSGAKGYNRYIMLRMTHYLEWKDRTKTNRWSFAYMYGQENNMLKDEIRSRSRMDPLYGENLKTSFFVMPANEYIRKDDYFIIDKTNNNKKLDEFYRVTGYDMQSQDGVEYVTIDPVYEFAQDYQVDTPEAEVTPPTCDHEWDELGVACKKCGFLKEDTKFGDDAGFWLMGKIEED